MTVLVSDSFNRANSTTTLGSTDSYNGGSSYAWQALAGVGGISSNQGYIADNSNNAVFVVNPNASDGVVTATFANNAGPLRLIFRCSTSNTYWYIQYSSSTYRLQKMNAGAASLVQSYSMTGAAGDIVKVTMNNSSISVAVNGTQILSTTDTFNQTATNHGFGGNTNQGRIDNFEVDDLNTSTSVPLSSTVKSTSSSTATPTLTGSSNTPVALSSTVKSNSSVTSIIKNTAAMISSAKSNSSATATVKTSIALVTTVKSNTAVTSNMVNNQALSSTVKSNSSTSNTMKDAISLVAANKSNTSATANISSQAQGALSSVTKSNTSSSANLGVTKPLSSTVKSSSTSSGTVTNNKPISSTTKSNSSSTANLSVGFIYISSTVKSRTSSTGTANSSLSLITNVKSKSTSWAVISYPNAPVIISTALLKGSRILNIELQGNQVLDINLKGVV